MTTPEKKKTWQPKRADWRKGGDTEDGGAKSDRMAEVEALTSDVRAKERGAGFLTAAQEAEAEERRRMEDEKRREEVRAAREAEKKTREEEERIAAEKAAAEKKAEEERIAAEKAAAEKKAEEERIAAEKAAAEKKAEEERIAAEKKRAEEEAARRREEEERERVRLEEVESRRKRAEEEKRAREREDQLLREVAAAREAAEAAEADERLRREAKEAEERMREGHAATRERRERWKGVGMRIEETYPYGVIEVQGIVEPGSDEKRFDLIDQGDMLVAVNQIPTVRLSLDEVKSLVQGPPGTAVDLSFVRLDGEGRRHQVEVRARRHFELDDADLASAGLPAAVAGGGGMDIDLDPLKIVDDLGKGITEGIRGISDAFAPPGAAGGRRELRESRM